MQNCLLEYSIIPFHFGCHSIVACSLSGCFIDVVFDVREAFRLVNVARYYVRNNRGATPWTRGMRPSFKID